MCVVGPALLKEITSQRTGHKTYLRVLIYKMTFFVLEVGYELSRLSERPLMSRLIDTRLHEGNCISSRPEMYHRWTTFSKTSPIFQLQADKFYHEKSE